jgi:hypothetical protein
VPAQIPKIIFGFNIGMNYSNALVLGGPGLNIQNGPGFRLGLVSSLFINQEFSFSPKAELSFNTCRVESFYFYPLALELMCHAHYKPFKSKCNFYLLGGPNVRLPVPEGGLYFDRSMQNSEDCGTDLALDIGIGAEKYNKYFMLAPELRYSIGLLNGGKDPSLRNVYFHNISLVLNFKG